MSTTRQLGRIEVERWLYRTDKGDYGPMPTDKLLEEISERRIDLGTQVRLLGTERWTVAAEHALFRNFYEKCKARWEVEDADKARKQREQAFMQKERANRLRLRVGIALLVVIALVVSYWLYRRSAIEGLGLARAARQRTAPSLPTEVAAVAPAAVYPDVKERRVPVLREPEDPVSYDVAGVKVGQVEGQKTVTRLDFDESGEVQQIDPGVLSRVVEAARQGVYACARQHAASNVSFTGTDVGFAVASGGLTRVTVGAEVRKSPAFQACVKGALARVSVPAFQGSERFVTIPVRVQH